MRIRFHPRWRWMASALLVVAAAAPPAQALPSFARRFGVSCQTCHTIPPRLNSFGQAFLANNFHWPGGEPASANPSAFPVSFLAEFSHENSPRAGEHDEEEEQGAESRHEGEHEEESAGGRERSTKFRELEALFAGWFDVTGRPGGYLLIGQLLDGEERAGDLHEAFVSLPAAGARGQWAVTAGQSSPLRFQWWEHTQLSEIVPSALSLGKPGGEHEHGGAAAFSFGEHLPSIRLDYFSGRGGGTPDGDYLTLGVPFGGHLALNDSARLDGARGLFLHAFRQRGPGTVGAFGYSHAGSHLGGLIATREAGPSLTLLGIAALGRDGDAGRDTQRLSLQGDYVVNPGLALTGRLEGLAGDDRAVGWLAALTYCPPLPQPVLRITLEASGVAGKPAYALTARGQF